MWTENFGLLHDMLVLIVYAQKPPINAHTEVHVSSIACGLSSSLSIYLLLYFVYVIKGSVDSAHMRRPNRAFGARQCIKYNILMCSNMAIYFRQIITNEPQHEISNNVVCATSKGSDQPAHMRSLIRVFASRLNILWLLGYWPNIIWSF